MRAVNLLPSDQAKSRAPVNRVALAGASSATALTMLIAAGYVHEHSVVSARRADLRTVRDELAALPKPKPQSVDDGRLVAERGARVVALSGVLRARVAWDRLLRELSSVLPDDVWLQNLNAKAPTSLSATTPVSTPGAPPIAVAAPAQFTMEGYTYSHDGVARLLARLEVVPELGSVTLQSSQLTMLQNQDVVQFSISAELRPAAGAS